MDESGMRFSEPNYHGWSVDEDDFSDEYEELFSDEEASQSANMDENLDCLHFNGKKYEDLRSSDMIGVEFSSVEAVDTFYAYYSLAMGFSFRKEKLCRNAAQVVVRRQLVCSKEGERKKRGKPDPSFASEIISCAQNLSPPHGTKPVCKRKTVNQKPIVEDADTRSMKRSGKQFGDGEHEKKGRRPPQRNITRGNCQARITARRCKESGVFCVVQFITEHNHALATAEFVPFLRSHRKVRDHDVAQVTALKKVSVGTCRAYEFLVHQAGGHEFVGFTIKDLYNKMDAERRELMVDGDAQSTISFMNLKASKEAEFFCLFSVDAEGRLGNMFWRDTKSLTDYNNFGDVLIIDSTYKTNIYGKPLAVFVGANNHRATVLFGCALLADESEDTYNWVVMAFLTSMRGKKPISVLTDGDEALRNAVVNLIPEARHRLCAWHIAKNVVKNVRDVDVQRDFCHLIFAGLGVDEWEKSWHYMVTMNGLQDNKWVAAMYNKRERWAEAFFRNHFFGGMCTTQRCEAMHRNLKSGVGRYMRLCEVLPRMDKTIEQIRFNGLNDDFKSMNSHPVIGSHMRCIQEQVSAKFTHDVFLLIKDQILFESKFLVADRVRYENQGSTLHLVTQYGKPERTWHVTHYQGKPDLSFVCSCHLFESDGIPCCHIFTVMKTMNMTTLPEYLVKLRWTKQACTKNNSTLTSGIMPAKDLQLARYGQMMGDCAQICHSASFSDEAYEEITTCLSRLMVRSKTFKRCKDSQPPETVDGLHPNVIRDPNVCKTKGTHSRHSTSVEVGRDQPGGRGCGFCSRPGHN
ncbi:protein FAR1-RELATED SEQUENCE 5-like, partial [Rosa sericea]